MFTRVIEIPRLNNVPSLSSGASTLNLRAAWICSNPHCSEAISCTCALSVQVQITSTGRASELLLCRSSVQGERSQAVQALSEITNGKRNKKVQKKKWNERGAVNGSVLRWAQTGGWKRSQPTSSEGRMETVTTGH